MADGTTTYFADHTVLLVDDEPLNRELLSRRLQNEGYSVATACNGQEAIKRLAVEQFSLLLLDLNMPVMNGYEVLEWLQRHDTRMMRVIMLTAAGERDAVNTCLTLGADDYILKSAGMSELIHRVRRSCQDANIEAILAAAPKQTQWEDTHILIVDDNAISLELMLRHFKHDAVNSYSASDGDVALKLLEHLNVDLVLLDYQMPGLNGLQVLEQIRQRWHRDDIGVIMVTAESDPDLITHLYEAGADDYLAKPFHATELIHRAQNVLLDKRLRQKQRRLTEFDYLGKKIRSNEG